VPFLPVVLVADEILHFHLLKFTAAENKIARRDFVAKGLADLRDAERNFHAPGIEHGLEIRKHALRRFGPQISDGGFIAQGADVGFKHHVERARRREAARLARGG